MQIVVVIFGAIVFFGLTHILGKLIKRQASAGRRLKLRPYLLGQILKWFVLIAGILPMILAMLGLLAASIWSLADQWRFPSALPHKFSLKYWARSFDGFTEIVQTTLILGLLSSFLSLLLVMLWLGATSNNTVSKTGKKNWSEHLLFLPLVLPQIAFLFGIQIMLLWLGLDGSIFALIWSHMLFVIPYIWLSLAPSWQSFNNNWLDLAGTLGASRFKRFMKVRMPIMIQPILISLQ